MTTETVETYKLRLTRSKLIELLKDVGVELPTMHRDIDIYTVVPGGGDWSGCVLDFDGKDDSDEAVIVVKWVKKKTAKTTDYHAAAPAHAEHSTSSR